MRKYEITYLVSDEVQESEIKKVSDKIAGFILEEGGNIIKEESWGRRKLTYPIKKQTFATYITTNFEIPAEKISTLDHEIRVFAPIIRHLIVAKTTEIKELVIEKEEIVAESDLEEVIGKKSFEVIKGQTEESYDLMAKRTTEEATKEETLVEKEKTKESKIEKEQYPEVAKPETKKEKKLPKTKEEVESESERIKKLDEKLDQLLSDDL